MLKYFLILVLIGHYTVCDGQLILRTGTTVTVKPSSQMNVSATGLDSIVFEGNAKIINDGIIQLDTTVRVNELPGYPITGSGYEIVSENTLLNHSSINPSNLGLTLSSNYYSGTTTIKRWHNYLFNQNNDSSIVRYYELIPSDTTSKFSFSIAYDSTELNGLHSDELKLFGGKDSVIWMNLGGISTSYTVANSDSSYGKTYLSLFKSSFFTPVLNDTFYCQNDSLIVPLTVNGLFNSGNMFLLEASANPSFTGLVTILDTVMSSANFTSLLPYGDANGDTLYLRVRSLSPQAFYTVGFIVIYSYPVINLSGLSLTYCNNEPIDTLHAIPFGGIFSGTGLNDSIFNPLLANIGNNLLTYEVQYGHCLSKDSLEIVVFDAPVVTLSSPVSNVCDNSSSFVVNGTPLEGTFSGGAITDSLFIPSNGIPGNNFIYYSYTDTNGCSNQDTGVIMIYSSPVILFSNPDTICINEAPVNLNALPVGGIWSGSSITDSVNGTLLPVTSGLTSFNYTYTDSNSCQSTLGSSILVLDAPIVPVITIGFDSLFVSTVATDYDWYLNGVFLLSTSTNYIIATSNGDYTVQATNANGCSAVSDTLYYGAVTVNENGSENSGIVVYPNPLTSQETMHVSGATDNSPFSIYSIDGKIITSDNLKNNTIDIKLPSGVYYIEFNSGKMKTKVIVTK